jgi:putative ABC transport system substrate-binding protein
MRFSPWLALTAFLCLSSSQPAFGQKPYRIAALIANDQFLPAVDGFKKKMAELGYAEGQNITYGVHNAHGNQEKLRELAEKIGRGRPDLIVTSSTTATAPIAKVTAGTNIPVVFLSAGNPLSLVNSYSSSGNNLTGISTSSIDLTEKRLELLKELAPDIRKVIAFHNPAGQNYKENREATEKAAKRLGLVLVEVNATSHEEVIRKAKEVLKPGFVGGIIQPPDAIINEAIREITPDINKLKLPSVAVNLGSVKAGATVPSGIIVDGVATIVTSWF